VVEDDPDCAEVTCTIAGMDGHTCHAAHTGREAFEVATAVAPHVVMIDIGIPDGDGYELARRLRATTRGDALYLIAVTGYGDAQHRRRAAEASFDAYVVKPVLAATIRQVLADARARLR